MTAPPSAIRRIAGNMAHLLSGKAAAGVISLAYIAIAARLLGVHDYGVLNLVHGYAVFVGGLIAFSGFHGIVRYGAAALEDRAHDRFRALVRLMALIELALALLAIGIGVLAVPWAARAMGWGADAAAIAPVYCLAILATVRTTPHGLLQLADRFDLIGAHQAIMPALRLVGALAILTFGGGLTAFLWVWLASAVAEGVSMWALGWWVYRAMPLARDGRLAIGAARAQSPGLLRFIGITNFDLTLRDFAPRLMPLLVGALLGPAAAGLLSLAQRASAVLVQPAQMLGQAGYPVIAGLFARGALVEGDRAVRRAALGATAASLAIAGLLALFARPLLVLLGGNGFAGGAALLALTALGRALIGGAPTLSAALAALGRPGASANANLVSAIALLPLLIPLTRWLGIDGVGWHAILQGLVLAIMLGWSYRRAIGRA